MQQKTPENKNKEVSDRYKHERDVVNLRQKLERETLKSQLEQQKIDKAKRSVEVSKIQDDDIRETLEGELSEVREDKLEITPDDSTIYDVNEFLGGRTISSVRQALEGTAEFLTQKGSGEFSQDELFDEASKIYNYEVKWNKNRVSAFKRMQTSGFLITRSNGKFRAKT